MSYSVSFKLKYIKICLFLGGLNVRFLNLFIKGIFVGVANVIPGVSGGTIAVVLRIFDEMIDAINNFYKDFKKYSLFLIPLGLGALVGIGIFSKLIEFCLENYSLPTNLFFIGLVVGSIPLIYGKAAEKKVKKWYFLVSAVSFLIVAGISLIKEPEDTTVNSVLNFSAVIEIFLGGIIASSAMVIPGISGSFVMVLLGLYNTIITSISGFINKVGEAFVYLSEGKTFLECLKHVVISDETIILVTAGIGIVIGIVIISKIIALLFEKAFSVTYFAILGLIFGSIFSIFKAPETYQSGVSVSAVIVSVFTFLLGFVISLILGREK